MAKKEVKTDFYVYELLKEVGIELTPQGCDIDEVNKALQTASKNMTGKEGYPEFCGRVKDFILVIEDKSDINKHVCRDELGLISMDKQPVKDFAVNGALHYAKHITEKTNFHKVIAFGVSGNAEHHLISPLFVDDRGNYMELPDVTTFVSFSPNNIEEYYTREILKEETDIEKTTQEILKDAGDLHEALHNYGSLTNEQKPLVVSGILLALREQEFGNFDISQLSGDDNTTDGEKIYSAIRSNLQRANVTPETKRDKLLSQFAVIKDTQKINAPEEHLGKTPLRYYTEFLNEKIFKSIRYNKTPEDYLGLFYSEFMSYSGADGQTLGIVLTPRHITELFCALADLKPEDKVLDPCCGTAGFLISAMHYMLHLTDNITQQNHIRKEQLFGIEQQSYMFTIATTNMILRGDGKSNLICEDFLKQKPAQLQLKGCTVGMMNPPYSQGSKKDPSLYEINFTKHLLDSLVKDGRCVVIIPQSAVTGKSNDEIVIKRSILSHHTLEGVITVNQNTFYGIGTNPCIAVFTTGTPHPKDKMVKFINFEDDGFEVQKQRGLVETNAAKDKQQHMLDVWFDRVEAEPKFCIKTTIEADDEWLHSFYYFNDEIPTEEEFQKTMADYLTFEFNMRTHGRSYLFDEEEGGGINA